jgi:hypothetical protein
MTTLRSLVAQFDGLNDEDTIYARRPWTADSDVVVTEEGGGAAQEATAAGLEYLLEVAIARDVLATWSSWRGGQKPTPMQACEAILYYAAHDSYLPP